MLHGDHISLNSTNFTCKKITRKSDTYIYKILIFVLFTKSTKEMRDLACNYRNLLKKVFIYFFSYQSNLPFI